MIDTFLKPLKSLLKLKFVKSGKIDKYFSNKEVKEIFSVDDIYTPLSLAKEEIWKRWNDKELKKKVEEFLEGDVPGILLDEPFAVLSRHIASPNIELFRFIDLCKIVELKPVCLEYLGDKFRAENEDKYHLGKFTFFHGIGKNFGEKLSTKKIIDFDRAEGKSLIDVKTIWDENFIEFHHRILDISLKNDKKLLHVDETAWVKNNGKKPEIFYEKFLALFLCYGILFEDYLENKNEKEFTHNIVIPVLNKIQNKFGIKPLVVRIFPADNETSHARFYSESLKNIVENIY